MTLTPLTKKPEIRKAYGALVTSLKSGAIKQRRVLGWKGDGGVFTLHWHPEQRYWVVFSVGDFGDYWCPYGTTDPSHSKTMGITCEINPSGDGVNRRKGGVFLKDSANNLFLAHSGKVAGGRKGIGKRAFLENYSGTRQEIEWPDGVTSEVVVIGRIGGRAFLRNVGNYVHAVEDFKAQVIKQTPESVNAKNPDLSFSPEFEGPRKRYVLTEAIESQCDHGTVVKALREELEAISRRTYNTGKIDLFLTDKEAVITHLLEIKTDQTTTSLYQALGQVMLHGALEQSSPLRILVLPGKVSADTASRLARLNVRVLTYEWDGSKPVFFDLGKCFERPLKKWNNP